MFRALKTFSGLVTMVEGEIKEIRDPAIVSDLLNAKYIEEVIETTDEPVVKKATKKRGKSNGN